MNTRPSSIKVIAEMGTVHYPENLRKAFIINAPRVVSLIASIVFSVLHQRTRNKIAVTRGDGRVEAPLRRHHGRAADAGAVVGGRAGQPGRGAHGSGGWLAILPLFYLFCLFGI